MLMILLNKFTAYQEVRECQGLKINVNIIGKI